MERYEIVYKLEDIKGCPGLWIEQEYDTVTYIWERNGARYMVPFSKDCVIDINTGNKISDDIVNGCELLTDKKYRWMLINKFNKKTF